ncbi:unnamed protein product [Closterium sp. NIES-53]
MCSNNRRVVIFGEGEKFRKKSMSESEGLGFESQCVHFGHPSAGGCQRSTGDPQLILGKGYRHVGLGGYGRTDPLLNKPFNLNVILENVKESQQFSGFVNNYNRFVPEYAKISAQLMNLLKKDMPYKWDTLQQQAMEQLLTPLTTAPVLILPDLDRDYVVEEYTSDQAVGAVLMQDHKHGLQPIAYLSKKLHGAEMNYPIHDKEALVIVTAFKAWRCYLEGAKTTVYTDHCSLKYLMSQPTLSR